jgi:sec-independent protein translocase protein TatC
MTSKNSEQRMTIWDHLEELRWVIIRSLISIGVCAIPVGIYWKRVFELFALYPLSQSETVPVIIYTAPAEGFLLSIRIALTGGFIVALPYIFWQIWSFVAPGLFKREKVVIKSVVFASTVCFLSGFVFCYYLLPQVMNLLTSIATGLIEPFFRIDEYLDFLLKMSIGFGVAFQLPVVAFVLTKLGLITHKHLLRYFRFIIVGIFILAAVLTPPDVLSQILLAMPLLVLYALSILISYSMRKR